jgi:antagonist of KipI
MRSLLVDSPGLLTTVQDLGREGFGPLGISPSGAADPLALQLGNLLLGNPRGAASLEMTLIGGSFSFPGGAVIAVAGSDFAATANGAPLSPYISRAIPSGGSVSFGPSRSGSRCYLCIAGGIEVPQFLGSSSTHLLSGIGGFHGRSLRKGDVLSLGEPPQTNPRHRISSAAIEALQPRKTLRATLGAQSELFTAGARHTLFANTFHVTEESNRMGLRLNGPALPLLNQSELISEGVSLGAIQVTPDGQPIILFVEQQTAGGYSKIANIIAADLPSIGQLRPRDEIHFEPVTVETACSLYLAQQRVLNSPELLFA